MMTRRRRDGQRSSPSNFRLDALHHLDERFLKLGVALRDVLATAMLDTYASRDVRPDFDLEDSVLRRAPYHAEAATVCREPPSGFGELHDLS